RGRLRQVAHLQHPPERLAEPDLPADDGQRLVREEVEVASDHAKVHLIEAEVGEDRQVTRGQHLVDLVFAGNLQLQALKHLPSRGQSRAAVRSDRNTETWPLRTLMATKKSSPTAASPMVPPMLGCCRRTWIRPSRSSVRAVGRRSTSQVSSSLYTMTATSSAGESVIETPSCVAVQERNGLR